MLEDIGTDAIIGTKQVLKAIQAGTLAHMYLADDVEPYLRAKLTAAANEYGVEIRQVSTMEELGKACKIDVGAACAGIKKPT